MIQEFDLNKSPIEGVSLIEASAGTGKTYTIVRIFLRLLLEKKLPLEKILVVTFTEAATAELRARIEAMIRQTEKSLHTANPEEAWLQALLKSQGIQQIRQTLKQTLLQFDEASIFTIHGFCRKMLQEFAFETQSSFETELIPTQDHLLEAIAKDYWRITNYEISPEYSSVFLHYAKSPENLAREFQKTLPRLGLKFLPAVAEAPQDLFEAIKTLFETLKSIWQNDLEQISDILTCNKIHRKDRLANYLKQAGSLFEFSDPWTDVTVLGKFSTAIVQKKKPLVSHPFFEGCENFLKLHEKLAPSILLDFFQWTKKELKKRKQALNQQSFDDLLQDLHQALQAPQGADLTQKIQNRFAAALIDEFQDTDPIQYQIFKQLFGQRNLFFIGDPKQAIYNFRGADLFTYLQAKAEASRQYTLKKNWRSDPRLVAAINQIFIQSNNPFQNEKIPFLPAEGAKDPASGGLQIQQKSCVPFKIWLLQGDLKTPEARQLIAESTAAEIAHLLNLGSRKEALIEEEGAARPLQPKDIAVLVRSHNEAEQIRQTLAQQNIPCVLKTQTSIFQTHEFEEVLAVAFAIEEYTRPAFIKAALVTDLLGFSGTAVFELMQNETEWETIVQQFYDYHHHWKTQGFYPMMRQLLKKQGVQPRLLAHQNGERRVTNLLHALELLHQAEVKNHWKPSTLLRWARLLQESPRETQEEHLIRLETDENSLAILTVHASKGLEFPIVFCPFSWGSRIVKDTFFHDSQGQLTWDLSKQKEHHEQAKKENLAEELRLVYVALTRAKYACYLAWGNINHGESSPFAYLFYGKKLPGFSKKNNDRDDAWQEIKKTLKGLEKQSAGNIQVIEDLPELSEKFNGLAEFPPKLHPRTFHKSLRPTWGISSFSSLSRIGHDWTEGQDHDQYSPPVASTHKTDLDEADASEAPNPFNLPKGANTGNCFHEILEHFDFQEEDPAVLEKLVADKLRKYHLEPHWNPVVVAMIQAVCRQKIASSHLAESSFSLADLPAVQVVKEMAFHFPIGSFSAETLQKVVRQHGCTETHESLLNTLNRLDFQTLKGFMKGYLDLVFCHQNRYYILDWKTNHLGNKPSDYAPALLQRSIEAHLYNWQYYIYTVALHKYLSMRIPDYRFQENFGGVYYLFLRGIQNQEDFGVYYDPLEDSAPLIEQLEKTFQGTP